MENAIADGIAGAITGAVGVTSLSAIWQGAAGAIAGGVSSITLDWLNGDPINITRALNSAALGGATSFVLGDGLGLTQLGKLPLKEIGKLMVKQATRPFIKGSLATATGMYVYDEVN